MTTRKAASLAGVSAFLFGAFGAPSFAQQSEEPRTRDVVVVTGTRIEQEGYNSPVPVSVLGAEQIDALNPANLADLVRQLPAITGGFTPTNRASWVSNGSAGTSSFDLRGLGPVRTLVLIDGRRSVATTLDGQVDINTIPQALVERVDIVTGGASAQYGSDAVAGVVNFVLDKDYEGVKFEATVGATDNGKGVNGDISFSAGQSLLDDRLHLLFNASYASQEPIHSAPGSWNDTGTFVIQNPDYTPTNGQPEFLVRSGVGLSTASAGGLINSGPLKGTYFLEPGVAPRLNYGRVTGPWMIGGDWQTTLEGAVNVVGLVPEQQRLGLFQRTEYDLTDNVSLYGQFSWHQSQAVSRGYSALYTGFNVAIKDDNAFLLTQYPQVAAAMQANGVSSFTMGTAFGGWPLYGTDVQRDVFRNTIGLEGNVFWFGRDWSWDAYYQHGVSKTDLEVFNSFNRARLALGTDAVLSNGQIVCRSTLTDPNNGCVPINRLGTNGPSAEALRYVFGPMRPGRTDKITQDVASLTVNGELFSLPEGPLAIAFGGELRKEKISGEVPPHSRAGWFLGNFLPTVGSYDIKEGFVELSAPVLPGLEVNAAGRVADYSTSGTETTWKFGALYSPVSGVRFRGTYSRDLRAPNMQELFAPGVTNDNSVFLPPNSPTPGQNQIVRELGGNPNLQPETAKTWTAGVVLTPGFLPGFSASVDYYDIRLKNGISSFGMQGIVNRCYGGFPEFCDLLVFNGIDLEKVIDRPVNFSSQTVRGLDIEASYGTDLSAIWSGLPGHIGLHGQASHIIENAIDDGTFPVDLAGQEGYQNALPKWRYRATVTYDLEPITVNLIARGFNSTVHDNNWTECTTGCPTSVFPYQTIDNNDIPGALYFDSSIKAQLNENVSLTLVVQNLFDKKPAVAGAIGPDPTDVGYPQTHFDLFDPIGRTIRLSLAWDL